VNNSNKIKNIILPIFNFRTFQRAKIYEKREISMNVAQTARWYKNIQKTCPKQPWFSVQNHQYYQTENWPRSGERITTQIWIILHSTMFKLYTGSYRIYTTHTLECPHYEFARTTCFKKIKMLKIYDTLEKCISILATKNLKFMRKLVYFKDNLDDQSKKV
jgi:hypothetical protein